MRQLFRERAAGVSCGVLLASLLVSCGTRDDNSLGLGFVEDQGQLKAVRYVLVAPPDSAADFQSDGPPSNVGSSPAWAVGSQPGYFSRALVQFNVASLPGAGTAIDSATVLLVLDDGIGTPVDLPVALHRVTASWPEEPIDPASFPAVATAADTVRFPDGADGDSLFVRVDSLAQFWIDNDEALNFGMALVPADSSGLLLEYSARGSAQPPVLTVHWNQAGTDTLVRVGATKDVHVIGKTSAFVPVAGQPGRLSVGKGLPSITLMRFAIPDLGERATVNRAVLTIHVDQAASNGNDMDVRLHRITGDWNGSFTEFDPLVHGLTTVTVGADSTRFEVGRLVEDVARNGNLGFLMRANENRTDTDFIRFHGADSAVPEKVPSLRLWYTLGDEPGAP